MDGGAPPKDPEEVDQYAIVLDSGSKLTVKITFQKAKGNLAGASRRLTSGFQNSPSNDGIYNFFV